MSTPAPPDMRDWGTVAPDELLRIAIVSPHLDDAVLGCSTLMAAHPGATVVTVFAGRPAEYPSPMQHWDSLCGFVDGDDVHAARRAEDAAALALLDATPVWLDFVEHAYLERAEWVRPASVVETLEAAVLAVAPSAIFVPFGLGNPDHDCTHDAAMLVRDRFLERGDEASWFCYEDTGYKHIPGLLAWRVARLFRGGVWPTPAAVPVDPRRERKDAALACYPSQLRALEAEWAIRGKLAAPAPEQFWRLAPPPPGWEGLATTT